MITTPTQENDSLGSKVMSVALIGPDDMRRNSVALSLVGAHSMATQKKSSPIRNWMICRSCFSKTTT